MCFSIFAFTLLALSMPLQASIIAGHDYVVLSTPQRQETNGKIEVVEFFSWGCPHCYEFYPMLSRWVGTLRKDASFKRIPVGLGHPEWEALAKAYYALQSTGDVDRLDNKPDAPSNPFDPCVLITLTEVNAALGMIFTRVQETDNGDSRDCKYDNSRKASRVEE